MAAKKSKRMVKKLKNLDVKAKDVRGGGYSTYMNFGDIKGESQDSGYKDWIEIMSYTPKK
ncbi:MAG TPA: type VI secretion system tube protein Hcp [Thermoanaerobaculia bacterium]